MPDALSRRRFLQGTAMVGAGMAIGACRNDSPATAPSPTTTTPPTADGTLVIVTLYGGNDSLNTVIPIEDPRYVPLRGALAIDPTDTHPIGEGFALHPALARCAELWTAERLSVVHGVGSPSLDRSHFHCMDEWQAAGSDHRTGWIGRWLDLGADEPLDAVVMGRTLPLLARGSRRSAAVVPPGGFALSSEATALRPLVETMTDGEHEGLSALVAGSTADLLTVIDEVGPLLGSRAAQDDSLAAQLASVATLIEAGLPTRVYCVALDGFDTHAGQPEAHARLLGDLDAALGDLLDRVADQPVTVMVHTEFGRRVAPNASQGTDHGQAGVMLLAGAVRAGHHGDPSPLDDLDDGDLRTTTDFRSVYGAVLEDVLGTPAADVVAGAPAPLDLV